MKAEQSLTINPKDPATWPLVLSHQAIIQRLYNMTSELEPGPPDDQPLWLIGVAEGGLPMWEYVKYHTLIPHNSVSVRVKTYEGTERRAQASPLEFSDLRNVDLEGCWVCLYDTIIDSGATLEALVAECYIKGALGVDLYTLVRRYSVYPGIEPYHLHGSKLLEPNQFVVGFGTDYNGRYRDLPDLRVLPAEAREL